MGVFSGSRDRAKATYLVRELTDIVLDSCERLSSLCDHELAPKFISGEYSDVDHFFAQIKPSLDYMKGLVAEIAALDSATRLIIERGSPSMRQMMITNNGELQRGMNLIYDQAMRIESFMLESNLVPEDSIGYWFKEMVYSEFKDYSENSKNFVVTLQWNTQCFL